MARRRRKMRKQGVRTLVTQKLEHVSKAVFERYLDQITQLVGDSPGVYALYDEGELYYVGKSVDLRNRVKHHLKDRHGASWTHFSVYLTRREEHIHEIESLLVRIANPTGNRVVPKGRSSGPLLKLLQRHIKQRQQEELASLFGRRPSRRAVAPDRNEEGELVGLVSVKTRLRRTYRGKDYTAVLLPKGQIVVRGRRFLSPSAAAQSIARGGINGWYFWWVEKPDGEWVKLKEIRR